MSEETLQPCGHPWSVLVDRPGYAWCSLCAQQAEALLPPAQPSRPARRAASRSQVCRHVDVPLAVYTCACCGEAFRCCPVCPGDRSLCLDCEEDAAGEGGGA